METDTQRMSDDELSEVDRLFARTPQIQAVTAEARRSHAAEMRLAELAEQLLAQVRADEWVGDSHGVGEYCPTCKAPGKGRKHIVGCTRMALMADAARCLAAAARPAR